MKHFYLSIFLIVSLGLNAQTTINYPQDPVHYSTFTDGGGIYDTGSSEVGMWANSNTGEAKQVVAFRNFTESGIPGGTPTTMAIGDSFTITINASRAYGQIGMALLASPTATSGWLDRHNNYAVQINMNGEASGSYLPWEVVSQGLTTNPFTLGGQETFSDFKFKFTLTTANTMEVSLNDGAEVFNVTLDKTDITSYCLYLADDWNGSSPADVKWKQLTEYTYATTLNNEKFDLKESIVISPNPVNTSFKINSEIQNLKIFDLTGKLVKEFNGEFTENNAFDISSLTQSIYLVKIENNNGKIYTSKLIKL